MASVLIVGGGVIGLSIAYECRSRGFEVTVIESRECGGQASGAAAGMLAPYSEITEDPDDFFMLCQKSLELYPDWVNKVMQFSDETFEYSRNGSLYAIYHEADLLSIESKQRWQREYGIESFILTGDEAREREPLLSEDTYAALWCPEESHIYAPGYVAALIDACRNSGVNILEHAGEADLVSGNDRQVKTDKGIFEGDHIVLATGAWSRNWERELKCSIPVFPIRGQICAYKGPELRHIVFTSQGYLVGKDNGTLIAGASEDIAGFDTSVTSHGINRLESWSKHVLPDLKSERPFHKWAGLRPATQDGFPLIGKMTQKPSVFIAAGHYRNGILLSPVTAKIIANEIEQLPQEVPIESFRPERFQLV
ncbi:glycine oxidase ThiO [Guptibacillus algicola]|uniref:glycine oxidase ThiO n=1 Tax=Guptibacillus algicola TaxID=225844 RepID=UPI001CD55395|nr:glycine oxidase ThiO [Alkalihalobacillus algicola]MCA0986022.1 glycine oxidase ThiO [Alkalihalobacillus algicola]